MPLLYVACWLVFLPKARLPWKTALSWLVYPLAYLVFILFRGALTSRYPYHFIDVAKLGYPPFSPTRPCFCAHCSPCVWSWSLIGRWLSRTATPPPNAAEAAPLY